MPERLPSLRRNIRWLVATNVLMFVLALAVGVFAYVANDHRTAEGRQAKKGLCRVRADRAEQVAAADAFLVEHPHGIPGIPASLIRQSRATAQGTVDALAFLHCERSSG